MTNKTIPYNTGKAVTRSELNDLIENAKDSNDWSKIEQANVSKITDMSNLFKDVNGIKNLNLDGWDTSNVVDMGYIFDSSDYNHPLHFDTSNVEDMGCMFYKSDYNHPLRLDTSNVMNMRYMFFNSDYNHPLYFDTSNVEDMSYMFYGSKYNHPLNFSVDHACPERARIGYNTSNVKNIGSMFCDSKYNHPLHFDTSNVEYMDNIFDNASITHPITFTGGNIPDSVQAFIDETNTTYEEKCKLEGVIYHESDTNDTVVAQSFKL